MPLNYPTKFGIDPRPPAAPSGPDVHGSMLADLPVTMSVFQ